MSTEWLWIVVGFLFALGILCVCWTIWLTARITAQVFRATQYKDKEGDDG